MGRILKIALISLSWLLLFKGCKKYPEGPSFTLLTVNHRIHGTYKLNNYIVNGIDSTAFLKPPSVVQTLAYTQADGNYYFKFGLKGILSGLDGNGGYLLTDAKKNISISYYGIFYPVKGDGSDWEIRKLTNKEFEIKKEINGITYEIHLKKLHSL